jgi:hypothetical protein
MPRISRKGSGQDLRAFNPGFEVARSNFGICRVRRGAASWALLLIMPFTRFGCSTVSGTSASPRQSQNPHSVALFLFLLRNRLPPANNASLQ